MCEGKGKNCFIVSTPYHLLVACSLRNEKDILLVEEQEVFESEFCQKMINSCFATRNMMIDSYGRLTKSPWTARRRLGKLKRSVEDLLRGVTTLIYFNDAEPVVQFLLNVVGKNKRCVMLEEGVGLYNPLHHKKKFVKILFGRLMFGCWYRCIDRIGEYNKTTHIVCRKPKQLNAIQNAKTVIAYDYKCVQDFTLTNRIGIEEKVIFIGQPLVEDGICSKEEYDKCIRQVVSMAYEREISLLIKPHPRENKEKYAQYMQAGKISVFEDRSLPAELMIQNRGEKRCIITVSSSSILNTIDPNTKGVVLGRLVHMQHKYDEKLFQNNAIITLSKWEQLNDILDWVMNDD